MAVMLMARPVMAATRVFEFIRDPAEPGSVQHLSLLSVLLQHFSSTLVALGGNAAAVTDERCLSVI